MQQQIRFCTSSDGVRLAYAVSGNGPPLLRAPHWITHLEHDDAVWGHLLEALGRRSLIIFLMVVAVAAGSLSFLGLGRAEDTAITFPTMVVTASAPRTEM